MGSIFPNPGTDGVLLWAGKEIGIVVHVCDGDLRWLSTGIGLIFLFDALYKLLLITFVLVVNRGIVLLWRNLLRRVSIALHLIGVLVYIDALWV